MRDGVAIRVCRDGDRRDVTALWERVFGKGPPRNAPPRVIDEKVRMRDGLLFVAEEGGRVVGTVMAGYDGHRGWLYRLAVSPERRKKGIAARLVRHAEAALAARGCVKVNLQVRAGNESAVDFYRRLGYETEERVSLGKELTPPDRPDER